jgi:glutathione synthase/RimK-type ligase-like ATP-grasp enzyme
VIAPGRIPLNVLFGTQDFGPDLVRVAPDGRRLVRFDGHGHQGATLLGRDLVRVDRNGVERFAMQGIANLVPFLSQERFAFDRFYLQTAAGLRGSIGPGAILNQIADPDLCSGALEMAARLVCETGRPCFNPPAAVARTSRDGVARTLAGIGGLRVPKTIRVQDPTPSRIRDAVDQNGLEYPVLLRAIGTHGGLSLTKADKPSQIEGVPGIETLHHGLYVTEFQDFMASDGRYRKFRVVVLGQDIFLRHCIIGDSWLLHAARRASGTEQSERDMFALFDREWAAHLQPMFRAIGARLGLDFFGVDCNIDDEGRVLVFEANACMNILKNTSPSPNMWDAPISRIKRALEERLASPSKWLAA